MADDARPRAPEEQGVIEGLTAVEIADLILYAVARTGARTVVVEPLHHNHAMRIDLDGSWTTCARLESSLADATVARLAILANLPVGSAENRVGRLSFDIKRDDARGSDISTEVIVVVRATALGLAAEVHALGSHGHPAGDADDMSAGGTGLPGTFGNYRIVDELGRGGMAVVYRAEHRLLQKPVALKVLHAELARDPKLVTQLVIEGRAAARVRHPGIVDVTDFGVAADGRPFIVMELIEAPTLSNLLEDGPLAPRRAVLLMERILSALQASYSRGVIHRDLTPANIFVLAGDLPKISDFGLARIVDPKASDHDPIGRAVVGTAPYMSPEQSQGKQVDVRSDIYALGCVFFKMLTGSSPFVADNYVKLLQMHRSSPVPRVTGADGPVPEAVEQVVRRAMEKAPAARYQSPDEMLLDLTRAKRALERDDWRKWLPA